MIPLRPLPMPTMREPPPKVRIGLWVVTRCRDGYDKKRRIRVRRCQHCEDWLPLCAFPWYWTTREPRERRRRGVCGSCRQLVNADALERYRLQEAKKRGK